VIVPALVNGNDIVVVIDIVNERAAHGEPHTIVPGIPNST
jgi:hypothetical protein